MKKIFFLLLLSLITLNCFAATVIIEEHDEWERKPGLLVSCGDLFYYTNRLDGYTNEARNYDSIFANGFAFEIGSFNSDEDGLIDFVSSHTFKLNFGELNSKNNFAWKDSFGFYNAGNDAHFGNFSFKDTFGLQVNFFVLSAGFMVGSNVGFDWLKMDANCNEPRFDYTYKERRLFLDFVTEPYISLNILHFMKIYFSTEFDFPVMRARFIRESYDRDYNFVFDFFGNDIPTVYKAGVVLFL